MSCDGSDQVTVRTRHGAFVFRRLRFVTPDGKSLCLLRGLLSSALQARCIDWATCFPFSQVAHLLTQFCGQPLLSEDTAWHLCQKEAHRLDAELEQALCIQAGNREAGLPLPCFVAPADLYDQEAEEFVTLTNAIRVASQKPTRQKAGQAKDDK